MAVPVPGLNGPLMWRVPPAYTALLFLVACASAALDLYAHPSSSVRSIALLVGLGALALAVSTMRMFFHVDEEGAEVRFLGRAQRLTWPEIDQIEIVAQVRGDTIRLSRADRTYVDVPPSLLQPARPTTRPKARYGLQAILEQVETRRPRP